MSDRSCVCRSANRSWKNQHPAPNQRSQLFFLQGQIGQAVHIWSRHMFLTWYYSCYWCLYRDCHCWTSSENASCLAVIPTLWFEYFTNLKVCRFWLMFLMSVYALSLRGLHLWIHAPELSFSSTFLILVFIAWLFILAKQSCLCIWKYLNRHFFFLIYHVPWLMH